MKLSKKRRSAIYQAVREEITLLRIDLSYGYRMGKLPSDLDYRIAQAGDRAATAAVKAAEGETV